jgi:hypothetical protein
MLNLTHRGVEVFMARYKNNGQDSFWNNYDLVIWQKDSKGFTSTKGMFRKDAWGISENVSVSSEGIWKLPKKYVKYFK